MDNGGTPTSNKIVCVIETLHNRQKTKKKYHTYVKEDEKDS